MSRRVVELPATELAHADHGEAHCGIDDLECSLQAHRGELGELPSDCGHVGDAEEVAHRDSEQLAPLPAAERLRIVLGHRGPRRAVRLERAFAREVVGIA